MSEILDSSKAVGFSYLGVIHAIQMNCNDKLPKARTDSQDRNVYCDRRYGDFSEDRYMEHEYLIYSIL